MVELLKGQYVNIQYDSMKQQPMNPKPIRLYLVFLWVKLLIYWPHRRCTVNGHSIRQFRKHSAKHVVKHFFASKPEKRVYPSWFMCTIFRMFKSFYSQLMSSTCPSYCTVSRGSYGLQISRIEQRVTRNYCKCIKTLKWSLRASKTLRHSQDNY